VTLKGHAKFTQKYENCRPPMSFGFTPIQNLGITFGYESVLGKLLKKISY